MINEDREDFIKKPEEWHPIPGSLTAIKLLAAKKIALGIATNQSGIGRKLLTHCDLDMIHAKMMLALAPYDKCISIKYCPHIPDDCCACRKPSPAMLNALIEEKNCLKSETFFVGDRMSDLDAALSAGVRPVLVLTGRGQETLTQNKVNPSTLIFQNLLAFSAFYIKERFGIYP